MMLADNQNVTESLALIVNPRSGGGRTAKRLDALHEQASRWFKTYTVFETQAPRHAEQLAREAADKGFHIVAAVGGDGTASEVVNGLVPDGQPVRPDIVFTVVPAGTGSDLIKTLRIPTDLGQALQVAAHGETRSSDVILVSMTCEETGQTLQRVCINMTGFCSNGDVVARVNRSSKRLGGRITFLTASLRTALFYRPPEVSLTWKNATGETDSLAGPMLSVFLANGEYSGGGMWLGRGTSMQDGQIKLTIMPPMSPIKMSLSVPKLYSGTAGTISEVLERQVFSLKADPISSDPVRIDIDGEQPGILPAEFSVISKVLDIRGMWTKMA